MSCGLQSNRMAYEMEVLSDIKTGELLVSRDSIILNEMRKLHVSTKYIYVPLQKK